MTIRIAAWNVAHQVKVRPIPEGLVPALQSLSPDIIVLTEFVPAESNKPGRSRKNFYAALEAAGFTHLLPDYPPEITRNGSRNHTLIASRSPMERGDLTAATTDLPGPTNFLHVRLPALGLEVAGIRVPSYKQSDAMKRYWRWLTDTLVNESERSLVLIGDLNVNPARPKPKYKQSYIDELKANGWQVADPRAEKGRGSYISKTGQWSAIDHALVSQRLKVKDASYISEAKGDVFASQGCEMSDHAVLMLEVEEP